MRSEDAKKFKSKCSPSSSNSAIFVVMHPFLFLNPQWKAPVFGFWTLSLSPGRRDDWNPSHSFSLPQLPRKPCLGSLRPGMAKQDQEPRVQGVKWGRGRSAPELFAPAPP